MAKSKMIKVQESGSAELRIALYARVSTDAQAEEGYSIEIQREKLHNFSKTLEGNIESITDYIDDGYSGGSLDRPRIQDLIHDIEDNKITHVIVYKLDRLSRSQKDTLHLIEDIFIPHNVAFISVQESFNTATAFGRAVIGILSVFAQLERENIYERTRSGMKKRVEAGYWMGGGIVPFGYDYDQNKGILVPNSDAETVRLIYKMYIDGNSEDMIAQKLSLKYDRLVHQILTRKSNTGVIVYKGEEYQGLHEPIIDKETYDLAMDIMKQRSSKKLVSKTQHLLTGLLECGQCGAKMRYQKWTKDKVKIVCYSRQGSKKYLIKDPDCDMPHMDSDAIEEAVLADIFSMTGNLDSSEDISSNKTVLDSLLVQEQAINKKIQKLYSLYAEEGENEYLLEAINKLRQEHENIRASIEREKENAADISKVMKINKKLQNLKDIWSFMTMQEKINAIRSIVDKIIVYKDSITIRYKS